MKKRVLLLLCCMFATMLTSAQQFVVDGLEYSIYERDCYVLNVINKNLRTLTIPSSITYDGKYYTVNRLSCLAIKDMPQLERLVLPNTINLDDFDRDDSSPIYNCPNLRYISSKDASEDHRSLLSGGRLIAFAPGGLTSYTIPNIVTHIGSLAFNISQTLTSLTIGDNVEYIEWNAFDECPNLSSVHLANSFTQFENNLNPFNNCPSLRRFTGKMASADNRCLIDGGYLIAFAPAGLTSYSIPSSVTIIGDAFSMCRNLRSVEIPNTVQKICNGAFAYCDMQQIRIPRSVTKIEYCAFNKCRIQSIILCNPNTEIQYGVLDDCYAKITRLR